MADEDKKPPKSGESEFINLKVLGQDNSIVDFRIKKNAPLRKLLNAYCVRLNISENALRFRIDGQAIDKEATANSMKMEEGDIIDAFPETFGGSD